MPFKRGASGNPKGRPKQHAEIKALALKKCPEAFKELIKLLNDKTLSPGEKLAVIKEIFDRGIGKPQQSMELSGAEGSSFNVFVSEKTPKDG